MNGLDFIARIAATGTVHGAGIGADIDTIGGAMGAGIDHVDNAPGRRKTALLRDYGLIEFSFNRAGDSWVCSSFSVQVHRLTWGTDLRAAWREAHGVELPDRVTWNELRTRLAEEYRLTDPIERVEAGTRYFRYPASQATVVLAEADGEAEVEADADVFSIGVSPWW